MNAPFVPPHPAGIMTLLEARGHRVTVRQDRNGSNKYRIDNGRELVALQMTAFFDRHYETRSKAS